jgi:hypothetical protein
MELRHAVPSPFQRNRRRRLSESVSARSFSRVRLVSCASITLPVLTPCTGPRQISFLVSCIVYDSTYTFGLPSLSDEPTRLTSPSLLPAEPIRLDDVLDTSILDSDPVDAPPILEQPVILPATLKPVRPMTVSAIFRVLAAGIEFLWVLSDVREKTAR